MTTKRIAWDERQDKFDHQQVDLILWDHRSGQVVAMQIDTLQQHDELIAFLDRNRLVDRQAVVVATPASA